MLFFGCKKISNSLQLYCSFGKTIDINTNSLENANQKINKLHLHYKLYKTRQFLPCYLYNTGVAIETIPVWTISHIKFIEIVYSLKTTI